ncbi:MAG: hypothetical protein RR253_02210, partial [Oscillospiraceae bacterium]
MKNKFWGTDIVIVILTITTTFFAVALAVAKPTFFAASVVTLVLVALVIASNVLSIRKIIRGVFFGSGKQRANQQLSFENLQVPVAIINKGSVVWYNSAFREEVLGSNDCYLVPFTKIVPNFNVDKSRSKNGF